MTRNPSATARRTFVSTMTALALVTAFSTAAFAQSALNAGIWKVDPANSKFSAGTAILSIARDGQELSPTAGRLVLVSKGKVYLMTSTSVSDAGKGVKQVDYANIKDGSAVLIGTNARYTGPCGFECQQGLPDSRMILTFKSVKAGEPRINEMLAVDGQKR